MKQGRRPGWLAVPALLVLLTGRAAGQGWVVDASAGGAEHEPVAAEIDTRSAILGLRYESVPWLYLAAGAPLDSEGAPWGAAGLGGRLQTRRAAFDVGADLAGHAFAYRDVVLDALGGGGTAEILPFVGFTRGSARVELSSGLLHYRSSFDGQTVLQRTLHHSSALVSYHPLAGLRLTGDARLVRAEEGDYPYTGAGAELSLSRGVLWGHFGRWLSDDMTTPVWSVGASAAVTDRVRLRASYEQESEDPLYWNLPRRSWNIGVSHLLGRRAALPSPLPVAARVVDGGVTIRLPLAEADAPPSVGGDFNGWTPAPMTRSADAWTLTLPLEPGVYRYAFQRADGSWFVPESVPNRVDDGFGGHSAVLVVPASPER